MAAIMMQIQRSIVEKRLANLDDQPGARAAAKLAATWRARLVRKRRVERRVPVGALLASIRVSRFLRRGLVSFAIYIAYVFVISSFIVRWSDQQAVHRMERQLLDRIDDGAREPAREDVRDLDSMWGYLGALKEGLYDAGQPLRDEEPLSALLSGALCPFGADSSAAANPCANRVCAGVLSALAAGGGSGGSDGAGEPVVSAETSACASIIATYCAAHPSEPACAEALASLGPGDQMWPQPPVGAGPAACVFVQSGPTNPCMNPVCAGLVAGAVSACAPAGTDGDAAAAAAAAANASAASDNSDNATNATADSGAPSAPQASLPAACTAVVAAHCAAFPTEPACAQAPAMARALAETLPTRGGRGGRGGARAPHGAPRRGLGQSEAAMSSSAGMRGMLDGANRVIAAPFVWHARTPFVPCGTLRHFISECRAPPSGEGEDDDALGTEWRPARLELDRSTFEGRVTGTRYAPGVLTTPGGKVVRLGDPVRVESSLPGISAPRTPTVGGLSMADLFFQPLDIGSMSDVSWEEGELQLASLRADGWLDRTVARVFVTTSVYNANLHRYGLVTVAFGISRGGRVESRVDVQSVPARLWGRRGFRQLAELVFALLVLDTAVVLWRCARLLWAGSVRALEARVRAAYVRALRAARRALLGASRPQSSAWLPHTFSAGGGGGGGGSGTAVLRRWAARTPSGVAHEGLRRVRDAEDAASHPAWLGVELIAVGFLWAFFAFSIELDALVTAAGEVFAAVDAEFGKDGAVTAESDLLLRATADLAFYVFEASNVSELMAFSGGVTVMMLIFRLLKYCQFHRRLATISSIVAHAAADLSYFGLLFLMITFGFAATASVLYGATDASFVTVPAAFSTLLLLLLGEIEHGRYTGLGSAELGHFFFWAYIVIVYLLLLNVLLAIIIDAYILAKAGSSDEPDLSAIGRDVLVNAVHDVLDGARVCARVAERAREGRGRRVAAVRAETAADALGGAAEDGGLGASRPASQPAAASSAPAAGSRSGLRGRLLRRASSGRPPPRAPLSAEQQTKLIHALTAGSSALDDALIARRLARAQPALLARGSHLSLAQLTELFGAVTATKVMSKYGREFGGGSADGEGEEAGAGGLRADSFGAAEWGGTSASTPLQPQPSEDSLTRTLLRIGRGVDRANEAHSRAAAERRAMRAELAELRRAAGLASQPVPAAHGHAGAATGTGEAGSAGIAGCQ